jgi:putative hemolysin
LGFSNHELFIQRDLQIIFFKFFILFFLLIISAFFSAAETALTSLNKIRLRTMLENKIKKSDLVSKICESPQKLLSTVLIGNNFCNICASSLVTSVAIDISGDNAFVLLICSVITTFFILILSEITPKHIASQQPEKLALSLASTIIFFEFVFTPIVIILNFISNKISYLFGNKKKFSNNLSVTEEDLKTMVEVSHEEGVLESDEREMIDNVVAFGDSYAKDVMIPRTDIKAININSSREIIEKIFNEDRFSRLPVFRENIDDIIGILNVKDFIFDNDLEINKILRKPYFTHEYKRIRELFKIMKAKRISMTIVLDEYGGTTGLITLEDLVEEIVGEIDDEYDDPDQEICLIKDGEYIVDGSTKISSVNEKLEINLESNGFESIGGYLIESMGYFPKPSEVFETKNLKFIIEKADKNRIEKILIKIKTFSSED